MQIIEINDCEKLNIFLKENKASMLQSFDWGEFQKMVGRKIWRIGLEENGELIASALIVKMDLNRSLNYLYCGRGPVIRNNQDTRNKQIQNFKSQIQNLFDEIKKIAIEEKSMFLRIDPDWNLDEVNIKFLESMGFKKAKKEVQPKDTWILDLSKNEEELMSGMHGKARYNIRLAQKKDIKVNRYSDINEIKNTKFEEFWKILEKTSVRDKFGLHPKDYYIKQLEYFGKKDFINLFLAELNGKVVAGIIVSFWGDTAVYMHGASDYEFRKYMAPNVLQWEGIKEAKARGCRYYDFWGIAPTNKLIIQTEKVEDWEGISRFKRGFGGFEKNYIGAWDLVYRKGLYFLYSLYK
ncbi:MAG: peptidoglycan bridge formation glycyltransferase FemA/FemB family protein [Patescibacteria group bacterium]|nr:peptidoglycan bridge formation glycyltransferase FemA/FemB family protein [Patescibacteria group bacterium]